MSRLWDEMLEEFRALGGTADNVCLEENSSGRGLFAIDPSTPVRLHVPESLLLNVNYAGLEDDAFRVDAAAPLGAREKGFLENYQRDFSWGASRHRVKELLRAMHDAPAELRELLTTPFRAEAWLAEPAPQAVWERFVASQAAPYRGRPVLAPLVELANYGPGLAYDDTDGIALTGHCAGELRARPIALDALEIFRIRGIASDSASFALSLALSVESRSSSLTIGRNFGFTSDNAPFLPEVSTEGNRTTLSYLLLGHRDRPGLAKSNFYRTMAGAGWPRAEAAEMFERIQHINRAQFYNLMAASEAAAPALGRLLRSMAKLQLDAMSHSLGM